MSETSKAASRGYASRMVELQRTRIAALRPLTPLLAAAAFAVTALTLVGSLLAA